jgi:hypothetical protein
MARQNSTLEPAGLSRDHVAALTNNNTENANVHGYEADGSHRGAEHTGAGVRPHSRIQAAGAQREVDGARARNDSRRAGVDARLTPPESAAEGTVAGSLSAGIQGSGVSCEEKRFTVVRDLRGDLGTIELTAGEAVNLLSGDGALSLVQRKDGRKYRVPTRQLVRS